MNLPGWLREPALAPVWEVARERLQRNGVEPRGTVQIRGLAREHRHAVAGLLGRPVVDERARIDLAALDTDLRVRAGHGLVAVVEELTGPLTDRRSVRSAQEVARQAPYSAVRAWLAEHPEVEQPWTERWLSAVRASGLLTRIADPELAARALVHAVAVAADVVCSHAPSARSELAARHTGDAHALDDGSLCGALVLRALVAAAGTAMPATAAARRELWEEFGVVSDRVSTTVLTLGLRVAGGAPVEERLRSAAEAGDPVHLTAWDLDRGMDPAPETVLVCENPRVLEAVAAHYGGRYALVCTAGSPSLLGLRILQLLSRKGCLLRYHGDFDWPGVAIANRLVRLTGCVPWRMDVERYVAGARRDGLPLSGTPVEPVWDDQLGPAMRTHGVAVHEEAVLADLLDALGGA
jgi:uncharacterized protein (TIGR02679 family)